MTTTPLAGRAPQCTTCAIGYSVSECDPGRAGDCGWRRRSSRCCARCAAINELDHQPQARQHKPGGRRLHRGTAKPRSWPPAASVTRPAGYQLQKRDSPTAKAINAFALQLELLGLIAERVGSKSMAVLNMFIRPPQGQLLESLMCPKAGNGAGDSSPALIPNFADAAAKWLSRERGGSRLNPPAPTATMITDAARSCATGRRNIGTVLLDLRGVEQRRRRWRRNRYNRDAGLHQFRPALLVGHMSSALARPQYL